MFIVKKKIGNKEYYYLRESKREKGKVKAVTLAYLGKTKKEAEEKFKKIKFERESDKKEKMTEKNSEEKEKQEQKIEKPEEEKKKQKELTIEEKVKSIKNIEDIASFCKRKGFVFQSSEIYGGMAGFWDFGPLGADLFNNIKQDWWNFFVNRENMLGIDASVISHPRTWKASGHLTSFKDVMGKCKKCKKLTKLEEGKCLCGGDLEKVEDFNLMFETKTGADESSSIVYLRPETAQGMFLNFKNIAETSRVKLPFGIAQIGKCFRNEIAPRDFLFRSREFTIAEFEFFINPEEKKCNLLRDRHFNLKLNLIEAETQLKGKEDAKEVTIKRMLDDKRLEEWHAYWLAEQLLWFKELGLNLNKLKVREHTKNELSHYSSATFDIDYLYPFGSKEVAGNANRSQYDLTQHEKESKQNLEIFDEESKKKIIPKVIEPTFGIERVFLAIIVDAYTYDEKRQNIVLKINPKLAPIKVAIFPIVKTDEKLVKMSRDVYKLLREDFKVVYDESGSVGRRYSRNDEIGTPFCITLDEESIKQKDVTIRWRDTTEQVRIKIKDLKETIKRAINGEDILKLGKIVETRVKEF